MELKSLRLYQYRNIGDAELSFCSGTNFLLGKNGQGKTNIIEAINVLSVAKSFRTSRARDLVQFGCTEGSVFGKLEDSNGTFELGLSIQHGRKSAYINGDKVASLPDFVGKLCCVCFSPGDLALVQGSPQERRRFMDRHLVDAKPALFTSLLTYQRALKHKNSLLKDEDCSLDEIHSFNQILAESGAVIIRERCKLLGEIQTEANKIHAEFSSADGELVLTTDSSFKNFTVDITKEEIFSQLSAVVARERAARLCLLGPHRDDIAIKLSDKDARSFASQGQARSIVLSLKLAVIEVLKRHRGESPIILLDDIDSELDQKRGADLFDFIFSRSQQTIITGTESRFHTRADSSEYQIYYVKNGSILHENSNTSTQLDEAL